jgi:hypothetical protein
MFGLLIGAALDSASGIVRMMVAVLAVGAKACAELLSWFVRVGVPVALKAIEFILVSPIQLSCWIYVTRRDGTRHRCQSCHSTSPAFRNLTHHGCPAQYQGWVWGFCPVCETRPRFHHCPNCRIANVNPLTRWPFKSMFE